MTNKCQRKRSKLYDANAKLNLDPLPLVIGAIFSLKDSPASSHLRKSVMSKFCDPSPATAAARKKAAVDKWLVTEDRNRETNLRLRHTPWAFQILPGVSLRKFKRFTDHVLWGILDGPPVWDHLFGGFSGGASTSRKRDSSHPAEKYRGRADVTPTACELWSRVRDDLSPTWLRYVPRDERLVPGNVMFTVPKNADIDRCACKEPDGNMYMQKGVGNHIRRRLRKFGINLNDQTRNKDLALKGSLDGDLATIDLSAASDSVTTGLCELLLPEDWFNLCCWLRSPVTALDDGTEHENAMMSSMGNGFTFELESLLFFVIAKAVAYFRGHKGIISVYGDDIIFPAAGYHDLAWVLSYFGFQVNMDKSFYEGPFRESCGGHYYDGRDVTPFYVRGPITRVKDLIHLGNQVRKWGVNCDVAVGLYDLWSLIKARVPEQFWGGRDLEDSSCLVTLDEPRKRLVEIHRDIERNEGDYLLWLDGSDSLAPLQWSFSDPTFVTGCRFRYRDTATTVLKRIAQEYPALTGGSRKQSTGRYRVRPNRSGPFYPSPTPWVEELLAP